MKEYHHPLLAHTRAFKSTDAPEPAKIDVSKSLSQLLEGYQNTAGGFLDLQKKFQPLYTQLGLDTAATTQQGYTDASGVYHPGTEALNTSNRLSNTADLNLIGPGVTQGILGSNPSLANALYYQDQNLGRAAGPQPLLEGLNREAQAGLDAGGQLTPEDQRTADQNALSFFGNAGINNGNSAIAAQLFSRSSAVTAAEDRARNFAGAVQGLDTTQSNLVGSLAGNQASTASNTITGPLMQILGLGTLTPGQGSSATSSAVDTGNSLFPLAPGFDVSSFNANAQNASNIAGANNDAATQNAWISLLGAFLSDDRIKKNIRYTGEKTPEGIPIASWLYKTDKKKRRTTGVMASDVEKVRPDAVLTDPVSGLRAVNYSALHTQLLQEAA